MSHIGATTKNKLATINYINNGRANDSTSGWSAYAESDVVTFQDTGDTVTLNNHGLSNGSAISFTFIGGTTGISINTLYYVISATTNTFQVASSVGGSALPLTTDGNGTMVRFLPKLGTGGSASISLTRSTSTVLRGGASFLFAKDAANRMGQGVSFDFTIDNADLAKVLTISFDYQIASGTFAAGDVTVYLIQDPTGTPVVIQPAGYQVQSATVSTKMKHTATFQTASNVTSYRLCIHVASVSASAYTISIDDVIVGPQVVQYGAPVTDWVAYTPTFTGFGTVSNSDFYWRRVGDSIQIQGRVTSGTSTAVEARISIPFTTSSTKLPATISQVGEHVGTGTGNTYNVMLADRSQAYLKFGSQNAGAAGLTAQNGSALYVAAQSFSIIAEVPVEGWSSTVQMSNDTDTRVVAARYNNNTTGTTSPSAPFNFASKIIDTHNAVTVGAGVWKFVAPVPGIYRVSATTYSTGSQASCDVYKNGSLYGALFSINPTYFLSGSLLVDLSAGDYVDIRTSSSTTVASGTSSSVNIERLSGPSAIAASETVAMRANKTTGNHTSGVSGWQTTAAYNATPYDTHGAFNVTTGEYTVPVSGSYLVSASMGFAFNLTGVRGVRVDLDGALAIGGNYIRTNTEQATVSVVSGILRATAGQKITLVSYQNSGGNLAYEASGYNNFSILRVGN